MSINGFIITAGSKALICCLSQFIKHKLKCEVFEKQMITSISETFLEKGSDSLTKKFNEKLFSQETLKEKYLKICNNAFKSLMKDLKYEKIFEEWFYDLCLNNTTTSDVDYYDLEISLKQWFSHHPSPHMDINIKINEFIDVYNNLIDAEIQKDPDLTIYFECFKNAKSTEEIEYRLSKIGNDISIIKSILSTGLDELHQIKEYLTPKEVTITKKNYPLITGIIERKVISYEYIQESTEYFHKNEAKSLLDYCKGERLLVLLGDAGCGKTVVLNQLAALAYNTEYYPVLISLSDYSGETIEELIQKEYTKYDNIPLLLIFDAFDETLQEHRDIFARKINSYTEYHHNDRIVISVRNNFYRFSDSDGGSSKFRGFKEIGLCPLTESDISSYVTEKKVDYSCFKKQIISNNLQGLVYNPFYLCMLTNLMLKQGALPPKKDLMEVIITDSFKFDSTKYCNPDIIKKSKVKLNRLLQEIAFSMQLMKDKSTLSTDDYQYLLEDESDRELLQHSALFIATNNEQWRFEHNNFREYLAAKYLDQLDFVTIKDVICSDKEHKIIRESWLNVISYLVLIHDEDDLLEWLADISPELLVKFEPSRIDAKDRNQIFEKVFNYYSNKNMYIARGINDLEVLVSFSCIKETLLFLIDSIDNSSTIHQKANAIKLISYFEGNLYNNEGKIRSLLLNNILTSDDYLKAISIDAMGKLKLCTPEITASIIKQLDTLKADSDYSGYIKYMIVKYIIDSDLYEEYIDLLLKIQEHAVHDNLSHSIDIDFAIQDIYPKITDPKAIASIIGHFSRQTHGYYNDRDENYYKIILEKSIDFYNNGNTVFLDIIIEAILKSSNYNRSSFDSIFKDFFIETKTLSIAIEKLLSESNDDNRGTLYKAKFFKLFCNKDEVFIALKDLFNSEPLKNQYYIDEVLKGLEYNSTRYNDYCKILIEKGFSTPPPPLDYNKIKHDGLQEFFNSLFNKDEFQKQIDELIYELCDDDLTYDNINDKFLTHFISSTSVKKEKLQHVIWAIKIAKFKDRRIQNFITHINNWDNFCIPNVVNILSNKKTSLFISEEQKAVIIEYCKSIDIDQLIKQEIKEDAITSVKFSSRAYYFCFLSNYFNIEYDIDTYKKMTMIPKALFKDDTHDNQPFVNYITAHLNDSILKECIKTNLKNSSLCTWSIISYIQYCTEKGLDYAIDAAEKICLNADIPYYYKKDALEYLIRIFDDDKNHYDYIYSKFLGTDDEELLNAMIQVTASDGNIRLLNKLEAYNSTNPDKTKFLIPLINMQSAYALEVYYSLAKDEMTLPDFKLDVSSITEAISNIKNYELLPMLLKLKDLLFSDGFRDKNTFGLKNSIWKALRNIADNNSDNVISELQNSLKSLDISDEEKEFCNNIIDEIEKSINYRLDKAWRLRDIKKFVAEHKY